MLHREGIVRLLREKEAEIEYPLPRESKDCGQEEEEESE